MPGLMLALALAAAPQAAPTPPDHVRQYRDVVISPKGDLIAAIESDDPLKSEAEPHPVVVVRSRTDGAVVAQYDPCKTCF